MTVGISTATIYSVIVPISNATGLPVGTLNSGTGYVCSPLQSFSYSCQLLFCKLLCQMLTAVIDVSLARMGSSYLAAPSSCIRKTNCLPSLSSGHSGKSGRLPPTYGNSQTDISGNREFYYGLRTPRLAVNGWPTKSSRDSSQPQSRRSVRSPLQTYTLAMREARIWVHIHSSYLVVTSLLQSLQVLSMMVKVGNGSFIGLLSSPVSVS